MVHGVHGKQYVVTGVTKPDGRGKHNKNHQLVSEANRQSVIDHINSFPVVDSHYCRAKTNKKYVEAGLNIEKMFDRDKKAFPGSPVKSVYYHHIFNTCFNIGFHVPKTDRCDRCEEIK